MDILLLTILLVTLSLGSAFIQINDEKRLTHHLVDRYKRMGELGRPVSKDTDVWNVTIGLSLQSITDVDFRSQSIELLYWQTLSWNDVFLTWSKTDFPINSIRVRPSDITMPDITAYNAMSPAEDLIKQPLIVVDNGGRTQYVPPLKQRFTCPMMRNADSITCSLKFGSWTYDGLHINMELQSESIGLDSYTPNPEWEMLKTSATRHVKIYECCPEPYIDVAFNITLKRI